LKANGSMQVDLVGGVVVVTMAAGVVSSWSVKQTLKKLYAI